MEFPFDIQGWNIGHIFQYCVPDENKAGSTYAREGNYGILDFQCNLFFRDTA